MSFAAIDPGPAYSGLVLIDEDNRKLHWHGHYDNEQLISTHLQFIKTLVIEQVQSYGNQIGRTVLDTAYWIGRFTQEVIKTGDVYLVPRIEVRRQVGRGKVTNVNDAQVRAYLWARFGKDQLAGVNSHCLQAYALANIFLDLAGPFREEYRVSK